MWSCTCLGKIFLSFSSFLCPFFIHHCFTLFYTVLVFYKKLFLRHFQLRLTFLFLSCFSHVLLHLWFPFLYTFSAMFLSFWIKKESPVEKQMTIKCKRQGWNNTLFISMRKDKKTQKRRMKDKTREWDSTESEQEDEQEQEKGNKGNRWSISSNIDSRMVSFLPAMTCRMTLFHFMPLSAKNQMKTRLRLGKISNSFFLKRERERESWERFCWRIWLRRRQQFMNSFVIRAWIECWSL